MRVRREGQGERGERVGSAEQRPRRPFSTDGSGRTVWTSPLGAAQRRHLTGRPGVPTTAANPYTAASEPGRPARIRHRSVRKNR